MRQFDENSELEAVIKAVKDSGISVTQMCLDIGYERSNLNNIRKLHNKKSRQDLVDKIRSTYQHLTFEKKVQEVDDENYLKKYIKSLEEEVVRLRNQLDLMLKRLLDDNS